MCVPDLTIYTYDWLEGRDDEPMPNHYVKHACVDWGELEQWVEKRRFSYADKLIRRSDGNESTLFDCYLLTSGQERSGQTNMIRETCKYWLRLERYEASFLRY